MPVRNTVPLLLLAALVACFNPAAANDDLDIPYEKFVLDNGLTLIVHEDRKAPIVAVNVWYHVGSKNEKEGKTGFAHLFEHLMFNGTENFNDDYFVPLEKVGATDMNGTTNNDRTNYFQNVPTSALDLVLWMESDRMGHLLGAIDQGKLDEQRGVVQNEKRQGENQPYGQVFNLIAENTFPEGHPYSWSVIGSMDDLNAASLEDVNEWFETYYGAANAILSVAGDIDPETAKAKVEEYFGDIPAGPPIGRQNAWIAKRTGTHRQRLDDRVPMARIYKVWNIPEWGTAEMDYLDLFSDILANGKNSRLYERLVYRDQIATDVAAFVYPREVAGQFIIQATARPGGDLAEVEAALDEELQRLIQRGPARKELERVKTQSYARFVRGVERIGGFGGKSDILALNEVYGGSPEYWKTTRGRIDAATTSDLRDAAQQWLTDGVYILEVHPFPEYAAKETGADRSSLPEMATPPRADFPEIQRTTLSNGLEIVFAQRTAVPVINFDLLVNAGFAADSTAAPGTARLTMDMLDEGTTTRDALEISEELALLGAQLSTSSSLDTLNVSLSALKENLDESLELFADVILNPAFPEEDFARRQQQQLDAIKQEQSSPNAMGLRVLPSLLYGADHPYGGPLSGTGNVESVSALATDDLKAFHQSWFKPNNATLIVVGDTTLGDIAQRLEKHIGAWQKGSTPDLEITRVQLASNPKVYVMDRPGAQQSVIFAAHVAPPKDNPDEIAVQTLNDILGGSFTSRINMNLREDKHWSYGARSFISDTSAQRPFIVRAPVQTDKTKESMVEVNNELRQIVGEEPPTDEELDKIKRSEVLGLAGRWETMNAVAGSIEDIVRFGLPDDFYDTYADKVASLDLDHVGQAASILVQPDAVVWLVIGDMEKVRPGIEELDYGPIQELNPDGTPAN